MKPKLLVHERDFFRQSTRIQAWDEYVLVSILCTSISYGALQTFQLNPDHVGIFLYESVLKTTIQVVAGMAVLSGLYSTMVFSLSILYGRTALGLERDEQYDVVFGKHSGHSRCCLQGLFNISGFICYTCGTCSSRRLATVNALADWRCHVGGTLCWISRLENLWLTMPLISTITWTTGVFLKLALAIHIIYCYWYTFLWCALPWVKMNDVDHVSSASWRQRLLRMGHTPRLVRLLKALA